MQNWRHISAKPSGVNTVRQCKVISRRTIVPELLPLFVAQGFDFTILGSNDVKHKRMYLSIHEMYDIKLKFFY